ncbi:MAG: hypothetical protein AB7P03_26270 [Kofleriaceae bacterium]
MGFRALVGELVMTAVFGVVVGGSMMSCGSGGGFPDAPPKDAPPPGGTFSLDWVITDANNQPITCGQIGATTVTMSLRNRAVQGGQSEVFTCPNLSGTSPVLPVGIYDIEFELAGAVGLIATAPKQEGIEIKSGQNTELAPLAFAVDATGQLELSLNAHQTGGNCAPAMDSAGIEGMTITLEHVGNGNPCENVTFSISAGASQPAGTYTVDCAAPAVGACVESDQTLTVPSLPSGNYIIRIRGKVGGTDCWVNNDTIKVPPLGMKLTSELNIGELAECMP